MNLSEKEIIYKIKLYQCSRFKSVENFAKKLCKDPLLNRLLLREIEKIEQEEIKKEFYKKFTDINKLLNMLQNNLFFSKNKDLYSKLKKVEREIKIIENDIDNYKNYLILIGNIEKKMVFIYQKLKNRI